MTESKNLIDFSDQLAEQLITYASGNNLDSRELIIGLVMAQRLLQRVFPGPRSEAFQAVMEGHATFDALIKPPSPHEAN